ncbi:MAG: hypothetical protein D6758_09910 [Gammaproteobacteria bacterium]|nr:MAG: hypothetical protein D6758_09910 [Gammaproteobacteria bacterium]
MLLAGHAPAEGVEEAAAKDEAQAEWVDESGQSVSITFSGLPDYIDLSQDPEEANRIPARLLTNPQLADIFVPGLFTPPAAGGPEVSAAERELTQISDPMADDAAMTAQQDSAINAAILFREFVDVRIVPTFLTQDIQNTQLNSVGR